MKIRNLFLCFVFLSACLMFIPLRADAGQMNKLTKEIMATAGRSGSSNTGENDLQLTNPDKKKEVQFKLGDQFKAYILAGDSPFRELNGKPASGSIRAMFGLHIPLK
jgi:hypothetical protein